MAKVQKINLHDLESYDAQHGTSLVRELEMAVDALVNAAYCGQFFTDCRVHGLREAKTYLLNFVSKTYGHTRHKLEDKFNTVFNRIVEHFD